MMNETLLLIVTLWPMIGGLLVVLFGRKSSKVRFNLATVVAAIEFAMLAYLVSVVLNSGPIYLTIANFCGMTFDLKIDGFRVLYSLIAAFMWFMTTGYTKEYLSHYDNQLRYLFFTLVTCGATVGVFLSADLYTTFIYFEIMSFTSYVMVIHDQKEEAMKAGTLYIAVAVIGGLTMLMGLFMLYNQIGTLNIEQLYDAVSNSSNMTMIWISGALILVGFGAKAGLYPLHVWLPKAHPVAPAPASALLSGILTKAGVFGMIVISIEIFRNDTDWAFLILSLGVITMVLGAVLALFSNNLKRTLACSSMSQIGFISIGIAMSIFLGSHNTLAVRGTILHMANHSLIKLLLFMLAGVIYSNTHQLDLNKIQGFGRKKWGLMILFIIGALGIGGIPLFNGYVSKTLLHESIVEYIHILEGTSAADFFTAVEYTFLFAGGLTIAYMTKIFIAIFVEKNQDIKVQEKYDNMKKIMTKESWVYLIFSAIPLLLIGLIPNTTADFMADVMMDFMHAHALDHAIAYFAWINLKGAVISITIGTIIYLFVVRLLLLKTKNKSTVYIERWPKWLDLANIFEKAILSSVIFIACFITRVISSLGDGSVILLNKTILCKKKRPESDPNDFLDGDLVKNYKENKSWMEIENSLSFGLLLFGVGICACFIYMMSHL